MSTSINLNRMINSHSHFDCEFFIDIFSQPGKDKQESLKFINKANTRFGNRVVYYVPTVNLVKLYKTLNSINLKTLSKGGGVIEIDVLYECSINFNQYRKILHNIRPYDGLISISAVSVVTPEIKIGGYSLIGMIDHSWDYQYISESIPDKDASPFTVMMAIIAGEADKFMTQSPTNKINWAATKEIGCKNVVHMMGQNSYEKSYSEGYICDHCDINRVRNTSLIFRRDDNNEVYRFGTGCAKEFLGYSIARVLKVSTFFSLIKEQTIISNPIEYIGHYDNLLEYVARVVSVLKVDNYNNSRSEYPTWEKAQHLQNSGDLNEAQIVIDWVNNLEPENNSYRNNIKSVYENKHFKSKHYALVASGVRFYNRAMEPVDNNYYAEVGELINCTVKLTGMSIYRGYSICTVMKFRDINGKEGVFFHKGDVIDKYDKNRFYKLVGEVKKHSTYKNVKSTQFDNKSKLTLLD